MSTAAPVPDVVGLPLGEALSHLAQAGWTEVDVLITRAPGWTQAPAAWEEYVARVRQDGAKLHLVVVETRSEPVRQGAP